MNHLITMDDIRSGHRYMIKGDDYEKVGAEAYLTIARMTPLTITEALSAAMQVEQFIERAYLLEKKSKA